MDNRVLQTQQWLNNTYGHLGNFPTVTMDGITGQNTFRALIWALQYECGIITPDGIFGAGTINALKGKYPILQESTNPTLETPQNIIFILQGSLWCKGFSPTGFTGVFASGTASAVRSFQTYAGLTPDGIVQPYILQGIMNTDSYIFIATDDIFDTYRHEIQKGINLHYGEQIGLIAPNGIWDRKSQSALIKAAQIEWGAIVDGKCGDDTVSKAPTISKNTSGYKNSKRILQWALTVNGFYPGVADGIWGTSTYNALYNFQEFLCLGADGICGKQTWASLMTSKGDKNRVANSIDTSKQISAENAVLLVQNGCQDVGRYLTNTPGGSLDKQLYPYELEILKNAGLNVFPIYQTSGGSSAYFTPHQGAIDAYRAIKAAKSFGFPSSATIYFAIDYDVLLADINSNILPYFRCINRVIGNQFKIGVYGPRLICTVLYNEGLATTSFVSDMSSGFTCNIGQKMPENWAYDQFHEVYDVDSEYNGNMGYDKIIASSRKTGTLPSNYTTYPSEDPYEYIIDFSKIQQLYQHAYNYLYEKDKLVPEVKQINVFLLQYLRQHGNYGGFAWNTIAGTTDTNFNTHIAKQENASELASYSITLYDNIAHSTIEISHFAATLNSLLYIFLDNKNIDAFAGWAGDLAQVGGILATSIELGGKNYFTRQNLKKFIGYMDNELADYKFIEEGENGSQITTNSGFEYQDLVQDVDAFNIYMGYDLATIPLYEALKSYYIDTKAYRRRYQLFERNLKTEFNKDTLQEVVVMFTKPDTIMRELLSSAFGSMFGTYDHNLYGDMLAEAFAEKIQYLIQLENTLYL